MEDKKSNTKESNAKKSQYIYRTLGEITSEITLSKCRLEELNAFTKPLNLTF